MLPYLHTIESIQLIFLSREVSHDCDAGVEYKQRATLTQDMLHTIVCSIEQQASHTAVHFPVGVLSLVVQVFEHALSDVQSAHPWRSRSCLWVRVLSAVAVLVIRAGDESPRPNQHAWDHRERSWKRWLPHKPSRN